MRVVMACVLSFVLALMVGILALPRTGPAHKSKPKPAKLQARAAPTLDLLPVLPTFPVTRIDIPVNQDKDAGPLLKTRRYAEMETVSQPSSVEPARRVSQTQGVAAASVPTVSRYPAISSSGAPHPPAPATVPVARVGRIPTPATAPVVRAARAPTALATAPVVRASRAPTTPATVPVARVGPIPTASSNVPPFAAPAQGRQVAVTRATPNGAQAQTPDVIQASPSESTAPDAYVLGPGDQIEVNVPHLAVTVTINQDGVIVLPLISPVKAAGKTTAQLAGDLTTMYAKVLATPSVTVFVRQPRLNR